MWILSIRSVCSNGEKFQERIGLKLEKLECGNWFFVCLGNLFDLKNIHILDKFYMLKKIQVIQSSEKTIVQL
jgi:hypothetical protein